MPRSSVERRNDPALEISVPQSMSGNKSPPVDHTFPAFAFEGATFFEYAGPKGEPNIFAQNLINEVSKRTGSPPIIRVGGTSLDRAPFYPKQQKPLIIPNDDGIGIPPKMCVGPSYFDSFANFPDARYVVMIPFALENIKQTAQFARTAIERIGEDNIELFEIGNEVDLYPTVKPMRRSSQWGPSNYSQQWTEYANAVAETEPVKPLKYEVGAFSNNDSAKWDLNKVFVPPLSDYKDHIGTVSDHFYQTTADENTDFQNDIASHKAIVSRMSTFNDSLRFLQKNYPSIPFVLGEVGMTLAHPGFNRTQQTTLGGALWQVDFMLYAMSIGIARVHMQLLRGASQSLFQATHINATPPRVFATYYAQLFAADFISATDPDVHVQALHVSNSSSSGGSGGGGGDGHHDDDFLAAYAAYAAGTLRRVALVNLKAWTPEPQPQGGGEAQTPPPPGRTVRLSVPRGLRQVTVKTLTSRAGFTAGAGEMSWAGMRWDFEHGPGLGYVVDGGEEERTVPMGADGTVEIRVRDSQAVMVFLGDRG